VKSLIFPFATLYVMACGLVACAHEVERPRILRLSDGVEISFNEMLEDLRGVQLVFVGERHNQARHHQAQLAVIRALRDKGISVAVGLEMFRSSHQATLERWSGGKLTEDAFEEIYYANWSFKWPLYRAVFLYAREQRLPMIGLNISPELTRQVAGQGFASLTPEQIGELPEVSCDVDATYMAFIQRAFGVHGHGKERSFVHFCEAQMIWDTAMASNLLAFHKKNPQYTIVVLAGSGHAWKRGIPEQVRRRSDISYRVILPEIPESAESTAVTLEDADYVWLGL
jgi:uncharacterized iron-regulated protein